MHKTFLFLSQKHSGASELYVQLQERKKKIYLFYKDNGKGIIPKSSELSTGLGLNSLKNRAEMLGGKMIYLPGQKQGTEYFFEIPLIKDNETTYTNSDSR